MTRNLNFVVCLFCLAFAAAITKAEDTEEPQPTLYLEFSWLNDTLPREALLIAPPHKVPLVILRVLSEDETLESLAAARGTLTQSTENPDELVLTCSEPRTIWGKSDAEKAVPPNVLITGKEYGAVDLGEKLTACLVKPVPPDKEEKIVQKYLPPEKNK